MISLLGQALELLFGCGEFGAGLVALALGIGVAVFQGDDGGMIVDAIQLEDVLAVFQLVHGVECVIDTVEVFENGLERHRRSPFRG